MRRRDAAEDSQSLEDHNAGQSEDEDLEGWHKRRRILWAQLIREVFEATSFGFSRP